jgi:hypothetical protein
VKLGFAGFFQAGATVAAKNHLRLINFAIDMLGMVIVQTGFPLYQAKHILDSSASPANEVVVPPLRKFVKRPAMSDVGKHQQTMTQQCCYYAVNRGPGQRGPLILKLSDKVIS